MSSSNTNIDNSAIVLARVSHPSQEEEGYSLDSQEKLLGTYTSTNTLDVQRVFRITESASKKDQRTVFDSMLKYLIKQDVRYLIVEKVDRLTRNFKDAQLIDEWLEADDRRHVIFVKTNLDLHKNSKSHDKFMWSIYVALAKQYSDNLREEVAKGALEKVAQGWYPHLPKAGYLNIRRDGKVIQVVDKERAPFIVTLFRWIQTGNYSVTRAWQEIIALGFRTRYGKEPSRGNIYKILRDPYYYGLLTWRGKTYSIGNHEPLISKELFDQAQEKMRRPEPRAYIKYNMLLKGLIRCDRCERSINWYKHKKRIYGECKNPACDARGTTREDLVETDLLARIRGIQAPSQSVIEWVEQLLITEEEGDTRTKKESLTALTKTDRLIRAKLDILYDDRLDGTITLEQYKAKQTALERQLAEVSLGLAKHQNGVPNSDGSPHVNFWRRSQTALVRYQEVSDPDARRTIFREIFASIRLDGGELTAEYHEEVQLLADTMTKYREQSDDDQPPESESYEPRKTPPQQRAGFPFIKNRLLWLSTVDALRAIPADRFYQAPLTTDPSAPNRYPSPGRQADDLGRVA